MKLKVSATIRGVEVEVIGESFEGDPSVGIPYGPEQVYAVTLNNEPFELTVEEEEHYTIELSKQYDEQGEYDWD